MITKSEFNALIKRTFEALEMPWIRLMPISAIIKSIGDINGGLLDCLVALGGDPHNCEKAVPIVRTLYSCH